MIDDRIRQLAEDLAVDSGRTLQEAVDALRQAITGELFPIRDGDISEGVNERRTPRHCTECHQPVYGPSPDVCADCRGLKCTCELYGHCEACRS